MSEYSIRALEESEWEIFREVRLNALSCDPSVFGSTLAAESARTEEQWREQLRSPKYAIFVLFEGRDPKGMTGIAVDRNDPEERTAVLLGIVARSGSSRQWIFKNAL